MHILKRPDYADAAIDAMLSIAGAEKGDKICDVGAGVAHLTLVLAARGLDVTAVEPNDAMRGNGAKRTEKLGNVRWHEGTGEQTGQATKAFDRVTFGSSINVCDRRWHSRKLRAFLNRVDGSRACGITANSMIRFRHRSN